jgi:hypothetical protein
MRTLGESCTKETAKKLRAEFRTFEEWLTVVAFDRRSRPAVYEEADRKYIIHLNRFPGHINWSTDFIPKEWTGGPNTLLWEYLAIRPITPERLRNGEVEAWNAAGAGKDPATSRFIAAYAEFLTRRDVPFEAFLNLSSHLHTVLADNPCPQAVDALLRVYEASFRKERNGESVWNRPPTDLKEPLLQVRTDVARVLSGQSMGEYYAPRWQAEAGAKDRRVLAGYLQDLLISASRGRMPDAALRASERGTGKGDPPSIRD